MLDVTLPLSLYDLDLQDAFIDMETGQVTGIIGFDGVAVRPAHIGVAAHPKWLTRNLNLLNYHLAAWNAVC